MSDGAGVATIDAVTERSGPEGADRSRHWIGVLWPFARPELRSIAAVLVLLVVSTLAAAATPWPITLVVDSVLGDQPLPGWATWTASLPGADTPVGFVVWMAAAVVALHLVTQLLAMARAIIETAVGLRITYRIGGALFDRTQRMPLTRHATWPVGDLMGRIQSDATSGRDLVFAMAAPAASAIVTVTVTSVVMVSLQPLLWLVAVASAIPSALAGPIGNRPLTRLQVSNAEVEAARGSVVEEALSALPSVRVLGVERQVVDRYRDLADRLVAIRKRLALVEGAFGLGVDTLFGISSAAFLLIGGWMVLDGDLTLGQLLVFLAYIQSLHAPLQTLVHLTTAWAATGARANRVRDLLDGPDPEGDGRPEGSGGPGGPDPDSSDPDDPATPPTDPLTTTQRPPKLQLTNITFAYPNNPPTLNNLTLTLQPGQLTALTGPSGTGKSTILHLIPRLLDPQHGTIHINNHNTQHLHPTTLRKHIATVLQDPYLFPTTIAHNIALGHPNPTPTTINQAAQAAGVTTFTNHLPQGLDTPIGERGTTLSGGQKQRIAIARALIRNPPILLLDEPTSALDTTAENHLMTTLKNLPNTTTLLITHKHTTLNHCHTTIHLNPHGNTNPTPPTPPTNHHDLGTATAVVGAPAPILEVIGDGRARYFERGQVVTIGRAHDAALRLTDADVDGSHLELQWTILGWRVEDRSSTGTYDQLGRRLGSTWLVFGDHLVRLGSPEGAELRLRGLPKGARPPRTDRLDGEAPEPPRPPRPLPGQLRLFAEQGGGS